jgi:hypothetical protein
MSGAQKSDGGVRCRTAAVTQGCGEERRRTTLCEQRIYRPSKFQYRLGN